MENIEKIYTLFLASEGICTDSRKLQKNQIFFALKGENFNGNFFATQALTQGALAVVVDETNEYLPENKTFLVSNALTALQELAKWHRSKKKNLQILAITGSNGKTTTKELIASVLQTYYSIYATKGNLNNHIGVPLSILEIQHQEIAIIEMGANHPGEIAQLCEIAQADFGLITNVGKAHLQGFGGFEGVKKTKKELYDYLNNQDKKPETVKILLNLDDAILCQLANGLSYLGFSKQKSDSNIWIQEIETQDITLANYPFVCLRYQYKDYTSPILQTQLLGQYNLNNLAYAIAAGILLQVPFDKINLGLCAYHPENSRSEYLKTENNTLIVDCYNANPSSMYAALENFSKLKGEKIAILGDMFELGETAFIEHAAIYKLTQTLEINCLFLGELFTEALKNTSASVFKTKKELTDYLEKKPLKNQIILLKASRGINLNTLIELF